MNNSEAILERLFFNLTSSCNLRCSYCYLSSTKSKDRNTLPLPIVEQLAYQAKQCGAQSVVLSGGEPFFRKDWFEVFEAFDLLGYQLAVSSNACLITAKVVERLQYLHDVIFQVSLDGCATTVDRLTGVKGTFARIDTAIERLLIAGYEVQLNCVLQKETLRDLPFLIRYSHDKDIVFRITLLDTNYGRATQNNGKLGLEEINRVIKAMHLARKAHTKIEINLPPLLLDSEDWFPIAPSCGWMRHQCGIMSNGDVTICGLASQRPDLVAGNIMQQSFEKIWYESPLFKRLRNLDSNQLKGICKICPFLEACGGSCRLTPYITTGDFCAPNGLCQNYYEALKNAEIDEVDFPSGVISAGLMPDF